MRQRISLDGIWDFLHASNGSAQPVKVRKAVVPAPWQAQFDDLRMKAGIGIYSRTVEIPVGWRNGRVFLCFGAVFHNTRVWVNGHAAGANEGGFLPFELDVTEALVEGVNEIRVRVESPTDNALAYPDMPLAEIPFGKQSWYGPLSGIWQPVHLESRCEDHIGDVRIRSRLDGGEVDVRVLLREPASAAAELAVEVIDEHGTACAGTTVPVAAKAEEVGLSLTVPVVRAWSPDRPCLYRLRVGLARGGAPLDRIERAFGFRTFEARDGRFHLNGEPFYLRAALDQDYYPDTICTVPSVEFLEDQFRKAKALGLNCIRLHIKAPDPRYYDVADRVGMLIWAELPNGGVSTERSRARKERLLKGIVDRDSHHPSIVIWTIINENWGVDLVNDASHRTWLKRRYAWLKDYDPGRLVVDNSPLYPSFHVETDIADYHFYAAIPDSRAKWDEFVDELAGRGSFLFSPEGDAVTTGGEPLVCSEFGNWGLPNPALLAGPDGEEPWWFETGHDWGSGVMYPHGVENRFSDWHLDRVFGELDRFIEAAQWQQFRALRYQIERMRLRPEIAGYVITELTDVHWEANGLMDIRRNLRVFHQEIDDTNSDTVVVPRLERWSYWGGERLALGISLAHGAGRPLERARVILAIPGTAVPELALEAPRTGPGEVVDLGTIDVELPDVRAAQVLAIGLTVEEQGRVVARNTVEVALHPVRRRAAAAARIWSPDAAIREHLAGLGYALAQDATGADLVVATTHTPDTAARVRAGGRLLLLPEGESALYPFFPHWQNVKVEAREGTPWQGDWASSFAWLVRERHFHSLPGGPLLDFAFDRVLPTHVITGCNLHDFHGRVHAGLVVGWIHKPVALAVERGYGTGRIVVSTFRMFRDPPNADPTATLLVDALIDCALRVEEPAVEVDPVAALPAASPAA